MAQQTPMKKTEAHNITRTAGAAAVAQHRTEPARPDEDAAATLGEQEWLEILDRLTQTLETANRALDEAGAKLEPQPAQPPERPKLSLRPAREEAAPVTPELLPERTQIAAAAEMPPGRQAGGGFTRVIPYAAAVAIYTGCGWMVHTKAWEDLPLYLTDKFDMRMAKKLDLRLPDMRAVAEPAGAKETPPQANMQASMTAGAGETPPAPQAEMQAGDNTVNTVADAIVDAGASDAREIPVSAANVVRGHAGAPLQLALALPESTPGAELSVMIQRLPKDVRLSAGRHIGGGTWILSAEDAQEVALTAPGESVARRFAIDVTYVKSDGKVPEARSMNVVVEPAQAPAPPAQDGLAAGDAGNAPPESAPVNEIARGPAPGGTVPPDTLQNTDNANASVQTAHVALERLIERGRELLDAGDVAGARLVLEHAARRGSASAMIMLAKSYDPEHLAQLGVRGLKPDRSQAIAWYERASSMADR